MDGAAELAGVVAAGAADGGYSLTQVDVDYVMQFLWLVSVVEFVQLAMLVLIAGLVFGALVTRKWSV